MTPIRSWPWLPSPRGRRVTPVFDDDEVLCAHHTAIFKLGDGHCFEGPCLGSRLEPVAVAVENDRLVMAE